MNKHNGTWINVKGEWLVKIPSLGIKTGEIVTVTKKSGESQDMEVSFVMNWNEESKFSIVQVSKIKIVTCPYCKSTDCPATKVEAHRRFAVCEKLVEACANFDIPVETYLSKGDKVIGMEHGVQYSGVVKSITSGYFGDTGRPIDAYIAYMIELDFPITIYDSVRTSIYVYSKPELLNSVTGEISKYPSYIKKVS